MMRLPAVNFDYRRLYHLSEGFTRGAIRVHAVDEIPDPDGLTRADVVPQKPVRFRWDEGTRLYDFIGTTWATLKFISDRFVEVLREGAFTGWSTYSIELRYKDGVPIHGYHGLSVTGRSGPIEDELSPIEILPPPVPEGEAMPHYMGLRFRPETWDGCDVFSPEGSTFVFVTEAIRDALVEASVSNVSLERLSDVNRFVLEDDD